MPIIKEYKCLDCGNHFETWDADPACPTCSSAESERAFLTAPGIRSKQTAFKDQTVRQLAADYGLSDISNKYGEPVKRPNSQNPAQFGGSSPSMPVMQALQRLGPQADGFSSIQPSLKHPNAIAANNGFPFQKRQQLLKGAQ